MGTLWTWGFTEAIETPGHLLVEQLWGSGDQSTIYPSAGIVRRSYNRVSAIFSSDSRIDYHPHPLLISVKIILFFFFGHTAWLAGS